ncbi:AAA family ATPase [Acidihalobacter aeolianus]|nr:AAA family ATPase [Acidihalobacter aeolianus]
MSEITAYFDTPSLKMLRNVIREHLTTRSPPVLVHGGMGSGKSALLRRLAFEMKSEFGVCLFAATAEPGNMTLHTAILAHWLPHADPKRHKASALLPVLRAAQPGRSPLLLIDDAEHLSDAELKGVIGLKQAVDHDGNVPFGLILCGSASLQERLDTYYHDHDPRRLPVSLGLRPFNRLETADFAHHLGYRLTEAEQIHLHNLSGGLPGVVLHSIRTQASEGAYHGWRKWLLLAGALGIAIALAAAWWSKTPSNHTEKALPIPAPANPAASAPPNG